MNQQKAPLNHFLQNPIWYITAVVTLAVATSYQRDLWWMAGFVALVWGVWLLRHYFYEPDEPDPPATADGQAELESYLNQTMAYKAQIDRAARAASNRHNRFHLQQLATQLDTCAQAIKELVHRLLLLRQDELIQRDRVLAPQAIADLEQRLAAETNPAIAAQLQRVLAARHRQLATLERLELTVQQTEIQIEHTLATLGTIYSQILIGQSTNDMADYGRLSTTIDEEMHRLNDQLEALYEVKGEYWLVG
jgi:hypothetical protein